MTRPADRGIVLTLMLGTDRWRRAGGVPTPDFDRVVAAAEAAKLHALFVADNSEIDLRSVTGAGALNPLEPITLLSYLAARTSRIGLVGTVSTSYYEPYNVARIFASLDHLSGGRAGWNVVTSASGAENFGLPALPSHEERYRRAAEFVAVVKRLWHSWEADAVTLGDDARARYRPEAIQPIDHAGQHFAVAGPLNVPRSPQGWPLLVQAGSSQDGIELARQHADAVFTAQHHDEDAITYARALQSGRGTPLVIVGVALTLAETDAEAHEKRARARGRVDTRAARAFIERQLGGLDLSDLRDDEAVPPERIPPADGYQGRRHFYQTIRRYAVEQALPIGELVHVQLHWTLTGSPATVADALIRRFQAGGADGYNIIQTDRESFELFVHDVVPELRRRGYFRRENTGGTLRAELGLPAVAA